MEPHIIRIHAAWRRLDFDRSGVEIGRSSIRLPDRLPFPAAVTNSIYRRTFNRPTGLTARSSVWLICGLFAHASHVSLNHRDIAIPIDGSLNITGMLLAQNVIEIGVNTDPMVGPYADATAWLEIR